MLKLPNGDAKKAGLDHDVLICNTTLMTTTISVTIDTATKVRAQRVALSMGVPLDRLMSQYLKGIASRRVELPARQMSKKLEKILGKVQSDFKAGKNISGPFKNAKEAVRHLNSL